MESKCIPRSDVDETSIERSVLARKVLIAEWSHSPEHQGKVILEADVQKPGSELLRLLLGLADDMNIFTYKQSNKTRCGVVVIDSLLNAGRNYHFDCMSFDDTMKTLTKVKSKSSLILDWIEKLEGELPWVQRNDPILVYLKVCPVCQNVGPVLCRLETRESYMHKCEAERDEEMCDALHENRQRCSSRDGMSLSLTCRSS